MFYVGLDLGQVNDYSALAVLQQAPPAPGPPQPVRYDVRHLERWKLGSRYPEIVAAVRDRMRSPQLRAALLVVDSTGVGVAVTDMLRAAGLQFDSVTITGGDQVHREGRQWRVPKRDLVSGVQVLLQSGRLRVAEALPEAQTLTRELLNFRYKIDPLTAHDSYGAWREGENDDMVLAVALACWRATKPRGGKLYTGDGISGRLYPVTFGE